MKVQKFGSTREIGNGQHNMPKKVFDIKITISAKIDIYVAANQKRVAKQNI